MDVVVPGAGRVERNIVRSIMTLQQDSACRVPRIITIRFVVVKSLDSSKKNTALAVIQVIVEGVGTKAEVASFRKNGTTTMPFLRYFR